MMRGFPNPCGSLSVINFISRFAMSPIVVEKVPLSACFFNGGRMSEIMSAETSRISNYALVRELLVGDPTTHTRFVLRCASLLQGHRIACAVIGLGC